MLSTVGREIRRPSVRLVQPATYIRESRQEIVEEVRLSSSSKSSSSLVGQEIAVDKSKRNFLKLAGVVGLGVMASQMLPKSAEAYVMGGGAPSVVGVKNSSNTRIDPATDESLATLTSTVATQTTLAQVQTQTAKLTFDGSNNLYVQAASNFSSQLENASNTVINPATEDSLAAIKTQTNQLTFTGGALVTTSSGGAASVVGVKDTTATQINPATEDSLVLLRRIAKIMESQASADSANRQRITIDSLGTSTAITNTIPVSGTVTATVSSTTITSISAGTTNIGSVNLDGQGHQMFQDFAKTAYATGIRNQLVFQ